ncbi:phosphatidylserine decarboxylase [Alkaliphilus hydrothermalis]|uniref:Phosphatidylserine decarboxylase proenzyme n=1 Tax=Alkaliphilus hydrothermalis TaxID=1482730 RepID=A0ABS2NMV4_9FIRM|nr:phosphatidylserine decarboxylase [Alkaliphilus hydrothermalis]MBM7614280.1 phosphatidylserine decarboxylase [Alkaliphilus hydrothermalis]
MTINYIDRNTGEKKLEVVSGGRALRWTYETKPGRMLLETFMKKKLFTTLFGKFMDTPFSRKRIQGFIEELGIDLSEAELDKVTDYKNFNEFFARKLKEGARLIHQGEETLISPADGKVLAYENIDIKEIVQIKGSKYQLKDLFQHEELAEEYQGGTCIVVRLAPADYHRFHFPDSGVPTKSRLVEGDYYSVSPYALRQVVELYCRNKREITEFESDHFGKMALVEVGATCVGSIIQTYKAGKPVEKGQEKGYFKFGGSTTVLFIKKGIVKVDEDIITNSRLGIETKVYMGESIGKSC